MSSWTKTRSQIAHEKRRDPNADVSVLKQRLKAERLEEYVRRTISEAPPLTAEQRDSIIAAFAGFTPGGDTQ